MKTPSKKLRTLSIALLISSALYGLTGTVSAAGPNVDSEGNARPDGCRAPSRKMTLYAQEKRAADGTLKGLAWGTTPKNGTTPGPTIEMLEGECLEITVVNDISHETLFALAEKYGGYNSNGEIDPDAGLGVSLHVHGVKYTTDSDGTTHTGSVVAPETSRTYTWYAEPRGVLENGLVSPGTAGYWWYHDHVVGTEHGTGGIGEGLYGALVVRRAGDPKPDVTYPVFMGPDLTINGVSNKHDGSHAGHGTHGAPPCPEGDETPRPQCIIATRGQRVEFAVVNVGNDFHTFHLHGHSWADNRTGLITDPADQTQIIDARIFGPSESFGFQVIAGHDVGPGDWMLHCHIQDHSDKGMTTYFRVR